MNILRDKISVELRNALWLSWIAFLESVQALVVLSWIFHYIEPKTFLTDVVYPEWLFIVRPEHEILLFRAFVLTAIGMQAVIFWVFRKRMSDETLSGRLSPFALVETIVVALMAAALFQMAVYADRPQLAQAALMGLGVVAIGQKIFWRHLRSWARSFKGLVFDPQNVPAVRKIAGVLFCVVIGLLIYIPNPQAVLARMFVGEQFHHYDSFIMAPGWAHISGQSLNMDIMSEYGVGMPIVLSEASKIFGDFSYLSVFQLLVWGTIVYFVVSFCFLRLWLQSVLIAMIGILWAIKVYMFHTGIFPFIFTLPSTTIFRYCFDIMVFFLLFCHLQTQQRWLLIAVAVICGFSIFYMTSTGMCLAISFYAYLLAHLITPHMRDAIFKNLKDAWYLLILTALVPLTVVIFFWMAVGNSLWTPEFAHNMKEFNQYFLSGFGTMPMYESLQDHNFLANFMGLWIPLVYMATLTIAASLVYFRKIPKTHVLVVIIALYGLMMYHYYIARSAVTSYYVVAIPYVFVGCYWLKMIGMLFPSRVARRTYLGILLFLVYALLTTHNYVSYPNALNVSRNPIVDPRIVHPLPKDGGSYFGHLYRKADRLPKEWFTYQDEELRVESDFSSDDQLQEFFQKRFDFTTDATLIDQLTKPGEKVALISSFEVKILMQANRPPFFYYFPLIVSRPMKMHMFATSTLYTIDHYTKALRQLDTEKPPYIFIEKTFYYSRFLPKDYRAVDAFVPLMNYVHNHYDSYATTGGYLIAMKRKDSAVAAPQPAP